jgi:hypothetical protein
MVIFTWATPRWLHQAIFSHAMNTWAKDLS